MQRILTALVLLPLAIAAIFYGGWIYAGMVTFVGLVAIFELYGLYSSSNIYPLKSLGILMGALVILLPKLSSEFPQILWQEILLGLGILLLIVSLFITKGRQTENLAATVFGLFYPAVFLQFIIKLREITPDNSLNLWIAVTVFSGVVATDTFAYYVGKNFGKHPLFPRISPSKTYEGLFGGILGCAIVVTTLCLTVLQPMQIPPTHIGALILICSLGGQLGDLIESMLKRAVSVKDSGGILPGHGGFLDRIDGLIFVAPIAYYFFRFMV